MAVTPADVRALRSQANLVQDYLNRAVQMDTALRREEFERVKGDFERRYPHYDWREWQTIEKAKAAQRPGL